MSAFRLPALAAVLAAAGLCAAAAPGVGRLESPVRHEILSCDKNHYILDEPCAFPATEFPIGYVGAVAVDPLGQVHFSSPHIVYRIDSKGLLIRVAGTGSPGFSGDGGPARDAQLNFPQWYPERENDPMDWSELLGPLAFDPAGNLYIGDAYNHRVRRVDVRGFIDTVDYGGGPQGVAVDAKGNLYVAGGWGMLHRLAPDGRVTPLAGDDCGHLSPGLCVPEGIAVDSLGNVYVADGFCRIRLVTPEGAIKTVAGRETPDGHGWAYTCGYTGDGPAPTSALAWPFAVALDAAGNLLIADTGNHCIRKVDAERMLTTIVGTCGGAGGFGGDGGPARDALLNAPHGVAVDAAGNIYIADTENHRVRMVNVEGVISTIAGNGVRKCRTVSVWAIEACDAP